MSSVHSVKPSHPSWTTRTAFVLAATGSAVGLGNIWKFPYITGENGGGAFVLVYLFCILLIGVPVMMAEIMIGRRGQASPINSLKNLSAKYGVSKNWSLVGGLGFLTAFIILSFYSVVAGWTIPYIGYALQGFSGQDAQQVGALFGSLLKDPVTLILWHSLFMTLTVVVSLMGINSGIERAVQIMMPSLFALLVLLILYSAFIDSFSFNKAVSYLFSPDFSKLSAEGVVTALGHAFFSLSLGLGAMIAYGSYMKPGAPIASTVFTIAFLDTLVALMAGLAIFPIVFSSNLPTGAGPGLVFTTLPLAFGNMPFGLFFGVVFFVLLLVAAWSSSISLLEVMVEYLEENNIGRGTSVMLAGVVTWAFGITTVLSFNVWNDVHLLSFIPSFEKKTLFDLYDYATANLMMPIGALFTSIFAGYIISRSDSQEDVGGIVLHKFWYFLIRYITPLCILLIFIANLIPK